MLCAGRSKRASEWHSGARDGAASGGDCGGGLAAGILRRDVVVHEGPEGVGQLLVGALQRREVLSVDVDGAVRLLAGSGEGDSDRRGLRLAGAVDDAAQ